MSTVNHGNSNPLNVAIKSAIDDAFSRCCAQIELGMAAYLGEENRETNEEKNADYTQELQNIIKEKEWTNKDTLLFLLQNGFSEEYPQHDTEKMDDKPMFDIDKVTEDQAKAIVKFIKDVRCSSILSVLQNKFGYNPVDEDYKRLNILMKRFGHEIAKRGVDSFSNPKKEETIQKRIKMLESLPGDKWNFITAICNKIVEREGIQLPSQKNEIVGQLKKVKSNALSDGKCTTTPY